MKLCGRCREPKPLIEFRGNKNTVDGKQKWCIPCHKEYHLLRTFGIDKEAFEAMKADQGGCCEICRVTLSMTDRGRTMVNVDHCHASGAVRGLLCRNCNVMLGHAADNPDTLRAAALYLEKHRG